MNFDLKLLIRGLLAIFAVSATYPAMSQSANTAYGNGALAANTGDNNSAFGDSALTANTSASNNSAFGGDALGSNTNGGANTALGAFSMVFNTTGSFNVAVGNDSLRSNTTGNYDIAIGAFTMYLNTSGAKNTALGVEALFDNSTGNGNSAVGYNAMASNKGGNFNTAVGLNALIGNMSGSNNTADGSGAEYSNTSGIRNSAVGSNSLYSNTIGDNNVAIGYQAGYYPKTGSNNIEIGAAGAAADNAVIRIGTQGTQKKTYLAGIRGTNVTGGVQVMVTSTGQLGVVSSSRRYKEDIRSMGDTSARLLKLHPVVFRYKQPDESGQKPEQYGLIAEEVAKVMPELVVYNDKGQPETVAYQTLTPLLLNELQREHSQLVSMKVQLSEVDALRAEVAELRRAIGKK